MNKNKKIADRNNTASDVDEGVDRLLKRVAAELRQEDISRQAVQATRRRVQEALNARTEKVPSRHGWTGWGRVAVPLATAAALAIVVGLVLDHGSDPGSSAISEEGIAGPRIRRPATEQEIVKLQRQVARNVAGFRRQYGHVAAPSKFESKKLTLRSRMAARTFEIQEELGVEPVVGGRY